jgi:hypothetical protein
MNGRFVAMVGHELRCHLGRWRILLALAGTALMTRMLWVDPLSGASMLTVNRTRVAYDSAVLASMLGAMVTVFIGLAGFCLVRGRTRQELANGMGALLASAPASAARLLLARWTAAVLVLALLMLAALGTVLMLHQTWVAAPIDLSTYLLTWILLGLPCIMFAASMAVLCDAWAPLIGRAGDIVYFALWTACVFAMGSWWRQPGAKLNPLLLVDFSGHYTVLVELANLFGTGMIGTEHSTFHPGRGVLAMPHDFLTPHLIGVRMLAGLLALLPLLPAIRLFHRYAPDRRQLLRNGAIARPAARLAAVLNRVSDRLARCGAIAGRALDAAVRLPGLPGQLLAELGITLMAAPLSILMLALALGVTLVADPPVLAAVLSFCLLAWAFVCSEISTRDQQGGWDATSLAVPGGRPRRYARQLLATILLGFTFCSVVLLRWAFDYPLGAAALASGLLLFAALAIVLGQALRLPRPFLFLFMLVLWISNQLGDVALLDTFGMRHRVTPAIVAAQLLMAALLAAAGLEAERRRGAQGRGLGGDG